MARSHPSCSHSSWVCACYVYARVCYVYAMCVLWGRSSATSCFLVGQAQARSICNDVAIVLCIIVVDWCPDCHPPQKRVWKCSHTASSLPFTDNLFSKVFPSIFAPNPLRPGQQLAAANSQRRSIGFGSACCADPKRGSADPLCGKAVWQHTGNLHFNNLLITD